MDPSVFGVVFSLPFLVTSSLIFGAKRLPKNCHGPPIWVPGPPILGAKIVVGASLVVFSPPDVPNTPPDPIFEEFLTYFGPIFSQF